MRRKFSELDKYEQQHALLNAKAEADKIIARYGKDEYSKAILLRLIQEIDPDLVPKPTTPEPTDDEGKGGLFSGS